MLFSVLVSCSVISSTYLFLLKVSQMSSLSKINIASYLEGSSLEFLSFF